MQRRKFIQRLAIGSGLLLPVGRQVWAASSDVPTQKKLIVIMLRGAVDGLNVVAPYGDAEYARLRPGIALGPPGKANGVIDLDGYFGLHPALADLHGLWRQKRLAFVHASGSPDGTRSHFDAQDYMETATPGRKTTPDGWMNRLLAALPGASTPTRAISVGAVMPRILRGPAVATNVASGAAGTRADLLDRAKVGSAFEQLYMSNPKYAEAFGDARQAHQQMMVAADMSEQQMADGGAPLPNGFPDHANRVAGLLRNEPNIQLVFMALGGWDTHANQGSASGQLANRLGPLGLGLATLAKRLGPVFDDTTIVVMSEFGRTAKQNGNAGTDHGHGNVMWLLGGNVAGGRVHGDWPGLDSPALHEARDLAITTDFRAVLMQVCEQHLRLDDRQLQQVLPLAPTLPARFSLFA